MNLKEIKAKMNYEAEGLKFKDCEWCGVDRQVKDMFVYKSELLCYRCYEEVEVQEEDEKSCECGEKEGLKKVVCGYAPTKKVDGKLHYEEVAEYWCEGCSTEEEEEEEGGMSAFEIMEQVHREYLRSSGQGEKA